MTLGATLARDARVIVTLPRWIGDAIEVEPALTGLIQHVGSGNVVFHGDGGVRTLLSQRFPNVSYATPDRTKHDVALLLRGSFSSAYLVWRAKIPRRVGWSRDARGLLLTDAATPSRERGALPLGLGRGGRWPRWSPRSVAAESVELLGLLGVRVDRRNPYFAASPDAQAWVEHTLRDHPAPIVVNLGSRAGSSKGFPSVFAGRLIDALVARGEDVVCVAAAKEHAVAEASLREANHKVHSIEPNLDQLLAVCARASVVVTPDGGVRHLASVVNAPRVVAFASTDPRHSARSGVGIERTFVSEIACGPCHKERCPLSDRNHLACWNKLEPEDLARAACSLSAQPR